MREKKARKAREAREAKAEAKKHKPAVFDPCKDASDSLNKLTKPVNQAGAALGDALKGVTTALDRVMAPLMSKVELGVAKVKMGVRQVVDDMLEIFKAVQSAVAIMNDVASGDVFGMAKMLLIVRIQAVMPGISIAEAVVYSIAILSCLTVGVYCSPVVTFLAVCAPAIQAALFDTDDWDDELMPPDAAQHVLLLGLGAFALLVACLQALACLPPTPFAAKGGR